MPVITRIESIDENDYPATLTVENRSATCKTVTIQGVYAVSSIILNEEERNALISWLKGES